MAVTPGQDRRNLVATVTIKLKDGREVSRQVTSFKGTPERPLARAELREKFLLLTQRLGHDKMVPLFDRLQPGKGEAGKHTPYHGYYYRILKGQGPDAPGGAYSYLAQGRMIGGFALVAWPAAYGNTGIMTFIVNQDGAVYQKDLGPGTSAAARKIPVFNPDNSWKPL